MAVFGTVFNLGRILVKAIERVTGEKFMVEKYEAVD
jgi:hypothetical protein